MIFIVILLDVSITGKFDSPVLGNQVIFLFKCDPLRLIWLDGAESVFWLADLGNFICIYYFNMNVWYSWIFKSKYTTNGCPESLKLSVALLNGLISSRNFSLG